MQQGFLGFSNSRTFLVGTFLIKTFLIRTFLVRSFLLRTLFVAPFPVSRRVDLEYFFLQSGLNQTNIVTGTFLPHYTRYKEHPNVAGIKPRPPVIASGLFILYS